LLRKGLGVTPLNLFGLFAVTVMVVCYALEKRHASFILAFAASCLLASAFCKVHGRLDSWKRSGRSSQRGAGGSPM
jgi:hypothetical protein